MPKIFRMTKKGKLDKAIFEGSTINTPSMLANEDYLDALEWAKSIGGYAGLVSRSDANLAVIEAKVASTPWLTFLAGEDKALRSNTSVCLCISDLDEKQVTLPIVAAHPSHTIPANSRLDSCPPHAAALGPFHPLRRTRPFSSPPASPLPFPTPSTHST